MTALTSTQKFALALMCVDLEDVPAVWDAEGTRFPTDRHSTERLVREVALARYVHSEGITPDMFCGRLKYELKHAHFAAHLIALAPLGFPADSLGGLILAGAGIPHWPVEVGGAESI